MEERIRFVKDARTGLYTMRELCERYNVSRKTGYKWTARFEAEGATGLADRSRAPHRPERRRSGAAREALLEVRRKHPSWGPRKILAWLEARHPRTAWPAASSVGELLRREGRVADRRRRPRREPHPGPPQVAAKKPNDLWTTDYKGQFPTRSGRWCYPLTALDHASRKCLVLHGPSGTGGEQAKPLFERAFREFGLPLAILSDNGAPFVAARGLHGLTRLSVWWLKLGIRRLRTEPASPEQNGAHERFHRTLEAETGRPPAGDRNAQQRRQVWLDTTNEHERSNDDVLPMLPVYLLPMFPAVQR
jgi:transposase InsO family protein